MGRGAPLCSLTPSSDGYTFYSVSQEQFLDELEQEAEAARAQALAAVEASKVREVAAALGPETIRDIARAGPELQVCGAGGGVMCQLWAMGFQKHDSLDGL